MSTIVVMPGGFHPFHAGHLALYNSARKAFPGADVYVAATNDTSTRPFPFAIKEKLAKLAGVEPGRFVQVKSPFRVEEITSQYNPEKDRLIFVRSEKDANKQPQAGGVKKDGSPAYLQPLAGQTNIRPFKEHAYMAYLPTVEFGPGMTSATEIRNAWPKLNEKRKTALVMSLYPKTQTNPKLAANVVAMLDTAMGGEELNEFAPGPGPNGGNYLKALASAWYNDVYNTGDLNKGIKSQEDVERILARGIHCGDGKIRKYFIGYNHRFDGVDIQSKDHYEYSDYDDAGNDIDSRTGKPWGPYDVVEFSDNDLDESLNEFAPSDNGGEDKVWGIYHPLHKKFMAQKGQRTSFDTQDQAEAWLKSSGRGKQGFITIPMDLDEGKLNEFAPSDNGGGRKFIPWPEFIDAVKQIVGKDFDVVEKVVKSTIQDRFVPFDPMEYGPTMLYSYYEARAGRGKGAVSTRGSIQVGKYYPNSTALGTRNFITSFNLLKGHPFERHFDLTFDNVYKIANIIMGNTEGAYKVQPVAEVTQSGVSPQAFVGGMHAAYQDRENQPTNEDYLDERSS